MRKGKKEKGNQRIWIWAATCLMIVLVLFSVEQFNESMNQVESVRNQEALQGLANQASLMAERRLQGGIGVLRTAARTIRIDQEDIHDQETMDYLREVAEENHMDRIGLTDEEGDVVTTQGTVANTKDSKYFQEAMSGNLYISNVFHSTLSAKHGITIAVPVIGPDGEAHAVLYGVYLVDEFNIYVNSELETGDESFVHIIDNEGNYIVKSSSPKCLGMGEENYFVTLKNLGVDVDEVKDAIQGNKTAVRQVEKDGEIRLLLFSPMQVKNWCVVTVLTGEAATANMEYSKQIVLELVMKILLVIAVLILMGYYVLAREKSYIKKLNRELLIKDRIFRIAVTETGGFVFTYNLTTKKLDFMNESKSENAMFPQGIEDFPNRLGQLVPEGSESYRNLMSMLDQIERGVEKVFGEFCLDFSGRIYYYQVNVTNIVAGESDQDRIAVGTLVDVTEERQNEVFLKSQIGQDPLTKTYNRLAAVEKINAVLADKKPHGCAFYIIDLDNFKAVNDSLGHTMGDRALIEVADTIRRHVRPQDIVCRLGGDEFVVFLVDIPQRVIARNVEALIKKLTITYEAEGKCETFSASVGIALAPEHGTEFQTLYEKADKALYTVKNRGKKGYAVFEDDL